MIKPTTTFRQKLTIDYEIEKEKKTEHSLSKEKELKILWNKNFARRKISYNYCNAKSNINSLISWKVVLYSVIWIGAFQMTSE